MKLFDNSRLQRRLTDAFFLTLGGLLLAVNVDLFLVPAQVAPGGVSGAAIMIHHFTDLQLA